MADNLIYEDLTYVIRGCLMEVYNRLGPGFREETYKRAVVEELRLKALSCSREQIVHNDCIEKGIGPYVEDQMQEAYNELAGL